MRRASLAAMLAILGGTAAAGALAWLARRAAASEPPSASFEEWIAAVVQREEAARRKPAQAMGVPHSSPVLRRVGNQKISLDTMRTKGDNFTGSEP